MIIWYDNSTLTLSNQNITFASSKIYFSYIEFTNTIKLDIFLIINININTLSQNIAFAS